MSDVQGSIQITAEFLQKLGVPRSVAVPASQQLNRAFGNGTGDSQVNGVAPFTVTPGAGGNVDIDLQAMSDMEGAAVSFAEIRGYLAFAPTANGDAVHMTTGAANPWTTGAMQGGTPELPIESNGWIAGVAPKAGQWTVDGASKGVRFVNQDGGAGAVVTGLFFGVLS